MLLSDTKSTDSAMASLSAVLSASEYQLHPWYSLADFYNKTVELFSKQIGVVRLLIALIVVLSISNTLSMSVMERTTEIGTSMAIGVRRSGILGLFLSEGVLLGIAGGLIGVALALVIGTIVSAVGIPMPPPPGMARGYIGEIAISPALVIDGFVLAFTTTLLASIFPAWKASRMNVRRASPPTMNRMLFTLALRNVLRQKLRTSMTLTAIAFGVAGLILSGASSRTFSFSWEKQSFTPKPAISRYSRKTFWTRGAESPRST